MGDDDKFIRDLVETAGELHPAFIALVGGSDPLYDRHRSGCPSR